MTIVTGKDETRHDLGCTASYGQDPCSIVNQQPYLALSTCNLLRQMVGSCALGGGGARAPCGGCAGWGGMNGGLVTPPPTYPNPHVPAQPTSPPLAACTTNITCSSPPHRIVSHIAHLLQLAGGMVDGVSVVWWLGRGAGSGQPGPHHQALSTGVSAREVERVSGGRLSTRRGGHRGNRQNILQGRDFDMAGLEDQC